MPRSLATRKVAVGSSFLVCGHSVPGYSIPNVWSPCLIVWGLLGGLIGHLGFLEYGLEPDLLLGGKTTNGRKMDHGQGNGDPSSTGKV